MDKKLNIAVLCGGQSAEHEISLLSAQNIVKAIDKTKYNVQLVGIDKSGTWHLLNSNEFLIDSHDPTKVHFDTTNNQAFLSTGYYSKQFIPVDGYKPLAAIDVVIPVLHGPNGEDGRLQGLLELSNIPYVGCGTLSSAMCMDKDITKKILKLEGIPVCRHLLARKFSDNNPNFKQASSELKLPLFIKPANMGSSVGVSKVTSESEYNQALTLAFKYDSKVLIEEAVDGRELEIALLGNAQPKTSVVGEVAPTDAFYSFEAKYVDSDGTKLIVPADIPKEVASKMSELAKLAFLALECRGLARCDFFYTTDGKLLINEINTFPGFTNISQYPMLWKEAGLQTTDLLNQLIDYALEPK